MAVMVKRGVSGLFVVCYYSYIATVAVFLCVCVYEAQDQPVLVISSL